MTLYQNTAERTDLADGHSITTASDTADTGGAAGNALVFTQAGSGTLNITTTALRNTRSYLMTAPVTSSASSLDWYGFSSNSCSFDAVVGAATVPSAEIRFIEVQTGTGTTQACRIAIEVNGAVRLYDAAGATLYTSTAHIPLDGTAWRISVGVVKGTTTSNGELHVRLFTGSAVDTTTPTEVYNNTACNAGTTTVYGVRVGKTNTAPTWASWKLDNLQLDDTTSAVLAPIAANTAPTATITASPGGIVEPGGTVTLTLGGTDPQSDALTCTVRQIGTPTVSLSGSGNVGSTRTFVAPAHKDGLTLQFGNVVNDGALNSSEATVDVVIGPHNEWYKGTDGVLHAQYVKYKSA